MAAVLSPEEPAMLYLGKRLVASGYDHLAEPLLRIRSTVNGESGSAQKLSGISLNAFLTALVVSIIIFGVQMSVFLTLRNRLARIFKPKTFLVPERERTEPPPRMPWSMVIALMSFKDREIINKCGLDAYFFLRYLKTLLVIFVPIAVVVIPILIPLNYVGGKGHDLTDRSSNSTVNGTAVTGLDTLAWGNIRPEDTNRYGVHLALAICVVIWVCTVFYFEMRVYIKVRQDYLTSAEHRLRASATTILVNSIPEKWLSEEALRGLFDVFPGGIRNIWLNRDLTVLLNKVHEREKINNMLEVAETELIRLAKKNQMKIQAKEEKKMRRKHRQKGPTKEEIAARRAQEDDEAQRRAEAAEGVETTASANDAQQEVGDPVSQARKRLSLKLDSHDGGNRGHKGNHNPLSKVGKGMIGGISKVGGGIAGGVTKVGGGIAGGVTKVGGEIVGGVGKAGNGVKAVGHGLDSTIDNTNGFTAIDSPETYMNRNQSPEFYRPFHSPSPSQDSAMGKVRSEDDSYPTGYSNTVRKITNIDDMYSKEKPRFWEFWKPPEGSYASPVPQNSDREERKAPDLKGWRRFLWTLQLLSIDVADPNYPDYLKTPVDLKEGAEGPKAEWEKWVKKKHRPTHRLPIFTWTPDFLPGLPLINKKVDTIDWCRTELARLNMEIEEDQKQPERYPLMNSAFIQFNHQVAAHMACQSAIHHVPKQMAPRINEVSPRDVIWDNMAIPWWQEWTRTGLVSVAVAAMIIFWTIPVAFTASLGQIDSLVNQFEWLRFLIANETMRKISKSIVGVLPALLLAILLILVPIILDFLAMVKGAKTGAQKAEFVQRAYFIFLFFQVFLIVSIASFFAASADQILANLQSLTRDPTSVLELLAENLPKSANYFFSYMILQAMSTSSGTLLQIGALVSWFVIARIFDSTARAKWSRNTTLSTISWGSFFPVYTNFACIALVYAIIAPLISLFAIITFSLLWVAQRYSMLYVTRFRIDTGGILYPCAINQTFTGLYVMELCLAGLFFIAVNEHGETTCTEHGVVMLVVLCLTGLFQILMNRSFGPLLRYLPITYEDEACIRDEAFQQAQNKRLGLDNEEDDNDNGDDRFPMLGNHRAHDDDEIEMHKMKRSATGTINPVKRIGTWANDSRAGRALTLGKVRDNASEYRKKQKHKDMEAQKAMGDALFMGYHDEIEDLAPAERNVLVRYAFLHYALRARRPTVWLPRDDIGVSDDEVRQMQEMSNYLPASNAGTALDSKVRVVYGRNPPDFSELELINL